MLLQHSDAWKELVKHNPHGAFPIYTAQRVRQSWANYLRSPGRAQLFSGERALIEMRFREAAERFGITLQAAA